MREHHNSVEPSRSNSSASEQQKQKRNKNGRRISGASKGTRNIRPSSGPCMLLAAVLPSSFLGRSAAAARAAASSPSAAFFIARPASRPCCHPPSRFGAFKGRTSPAISFAATGGSTPSHLFSSTFNVTSSPPASPFGMAAPQLESPEGGTSDSSGTAPSPPAKTIMTPTGGTAAAAASPRARRVPASPVSLSECGARLRSGHLVSFPTETVYGLGCHALDPAAVARVFEAKERPLSDPLIVHVTEAEDAMRLWAAPSSSEAGDAGRGEAALAPEQAQARPPADAEARALRTLASTFWPGPLTIVARASPSVPSVVMAGTGYVACRAPSHPVARAVIDAAGVPIAAPSANKFGHVSPTRPDHVLDDLGMEDVWVVDPTVGGAADQASSGGEGAGRVCDVGVESTVAKVEMSGPASGKVVVLRHGAVSTAEIRRALDAAGLSGSFEVAAVVRSTGDHVAHVAPGQTVRHYSPDVVSYMVAHSRYGQGMELGGGEAEFLSRAVVIDLGGRLGALRDYALAYRDLSEGGDSAEAAASVFDALRWAEDVEGAERVYFPELVVSPPPGGVEEGGGDGGCYVGEEDALTLAVKDRLTRAASGIVIDTLQ